MASIADSRSLVGARPVALIWVSWLSRRLLFVMVANAPGPCNSSTGSGSGFGIPKRFRSGPIARTITCLGPLRVMMKPPMPTWSPVRTFRRGERLRACDAGTAVGVAVAVAVAVAVGVGLALGVGSGSGKLATKSARSFLFVITTSWLGGV